MHWNINISLNSLHCILQNMTYLNALITSGSLLASTKMCCITHLTYDIHGLSFLFEPKPIPAFLHFASCPKSCAHLKEKPWETRFILCLSLKCTFSTKHKQILPKVLFLLTIMLAVQLSWQAMKNFLFSSIQFTKKTDCAS